MNFFYDILSMRIKTKIYNLIETAPDDSFLKKIVNTALSVLIFLNVVAVTLESVQDISAKYNFIFKAFELFSVILFSVEYILRAWVCTENPRYGTTFIGRIRYLLTPLAIIDLLAILPFYLPLVFQVDLRFLRAIRLFRLLRIFKLGRYTDALTTIISVIKSKKHELMVTVFAVIVLLVLFSSLVYFIENEAQPKVFSSIPAAMWWGAVTLTTVGYGDIYPVTALGKIFGGIIALLGIGLFALPAGILGSGFVDEIQSRKKKSAICPHCGKSIEK